MQFTALLLNFLATSYLNALEKCFLIKIFDKLKKLVSLISLLKYVYGTNIIV